jgi:undecaprenyl-diphosphatase
MAYLRRIEAWLLLAVAVLGGGLWFVLKLASEIQEGETEAFDRALLLALRTPHNPHLPAGPRWLQESARDVTALGGFTVLALVSIAAVVLLLIYRRRAQALVFGLTVLLAQVAAELIKWVVNRPRPDLVTHLDLTYSASFPSGHSVMAPVVYLTLAVLLNESQARPAARFTLLGGAALLVVAIGVSRVYLGVHWPTDVLGGWALGAAVALSSWLVLRRLRQRQSPSRDSGAA